MVPPTLETLALRLHADDDVAVLKVNVRRGTSWIEGGRQVVMAGDGLRGHKVAVRSVETGDPVHRYGQVIGFARVPIRPGDIVHTHNLEVRPFDRDATMETGAPDWPTLPLESQRTFAGYLRPDGRVGTRNYIAVISSVNCSASVSRQVCARFSPERLKAEYPQVDGVIPFTHKSGCCVQPGEPHAMLERVLIGLANHPNVFGYVLIGLGCEGHRVADLRQVGRLDAPASGKPAPAFFNIQQQGGVRKTVEAGVEAVERLLIQANQARRTPQPVSSLVLALNCGGSDGASGITANPALGVASDMLVRQGGTSVLAETPEIYGAEHLLARRAISREVGGKLLERVRWWEEHVARFGASIDNNPSPGNKEGGLTTIYEKSLGALAKAGQAPLRDVYRYAEPIRTRGLVFMDTPGFDPVSMTGLVTGGCNVAVFTTGRGSVYGCKPTPCLKVATNTALFDWMREDMDLNAGTILDGAESVESVGERIFEAILATASGGRTCSEIQGLGDEEFAPWILGPTF
jgi:altronate hydrolase